MPVTREGDCCILIAEDNEILRYAMSRTLSHSGYCVIEACDGQDALLQERKYDGAIHMLISNVCMPGIDGHELAQQIRKSRPDIKILIVSAQHEEDFPPEARSHDFALLKPVTNGMLLAKVTEMLRGQELAKAAPPAVIRNSASP